MSRFTFILFVVCSWGWGDTVPTRPSDCETITQFVAYLNSTCIHNSASHQIPICRYGNPTKFCIFDSNSDGGECSPFTLGPRGTIQYEITVGNQRQRKTLYCLKREKVFKGKPVLQFDDVSL